ncbi:hypothetical protein SK128_004903 [Halocaridina rubra]|uniref:Uncharacterized protein n=1 Tax=Halocaridina rubra TaxID=373956 RepID=A0AAN8WZ12_HALRR
MYQMMVIRTSKEKCYDTVDAHHQTASAHSGVVNGYLPNDLPNGIYDLSHKEKESDDIPCGKLSPCTKDGYSKALPLCGVTPSSVSGRTGESALYQGRSNISPSQASILDHFGTARIQCQTSEMSLGQSRLPVPGMFGPACVSGESKISSSRADNQRTLQCGKSPKYRRKFSLEEMVAKLHNRTELNTTCVNVLQGFPSVRPLVDSGRKMVAAENNQSNLCDKHNTAICDDARPSSPSTPLSSLKDASDKCDVDKPSKESERSCTVECPVNVSNTPSDASRGAIMVKISDAVAAILSDVSDDSLPPSPEESDINILKSFSNILPSLKNDEVRKSTSEDRLHEGEKSTTEKYVSDKSNKNVKACNIDGATDELAQRPTDKCVNDEEPVTGRLLQQGQDTSHSSASARISR